MPRLSQYHGCYYVFISEPCDYMLSLPWSTMDHRWWFFQHEPAGEPNLTSSWQVRRCFAPGIGWLWGFPGELWTIGEGLKVGPGTHGGSPTCRYFLFKDPQVCKCAVPLIFEHTSLFFWFLLAFCCLYPRPFLLPDSCRTHIAGWPANEDPTIQKLKHRRAAHQFAYHIYIKLHSHIDYITTYIYIHIYILYKYIRHAPFPFFWESFSDQASAARAAR
jgi:hypothetical protein